MRIEAKRIIEKSLLAIGILCLAAYGAGKLYSMLGSSIGLSRFDLPLNGVGSAGSAFFSLRSDKPDYTLWSEKRIAAYKQTLLMKFDAPLAVLRVPKLRLQVPVFDGTDDLILNRGAGRILGTAMPGSSGNVGIAAHRDGFFRSLKDVEIGDKLDLATQTGTMTYAIDDIEIVLPQDVTVLQPRSRPSVTLVTCYPFYFIGDAPQRYIVHASLIRDDRAPSASTASMQRASRQSSEVAQ